MTFIAYNLHPPEEISIFFSLSLIFETNPKPATGLFPCDLNFFFALFCPTPPHVVVASFFFLFFQRFYDASPFVKWEISPRLCTLSLAVGLRGYTSRCLLPLSHLLRHFFSSILSLLICVLSCRPSFEVTSLLLFHFPRVRKPTFLFEPLFLMLFSELVAPFLLVDT